jgi:hypothetical protein
VFPELEPLAAHILRKLSAEECSDNFKYYQNRIDAYGGVSKLLIDMMTAIDLPFRDLQGKLVTLKA